MLKFCVLASSSSGNCALVATPQTRLLIDAGLSAKETYARLEAIGENPCDIDAILITHEHSDHVCGLPALARKLSKDKNQPVPVYLTKLTAPMIDWNSTTGPPEVIEFQAGTRFRIGDIEVTSFTIPHDAVDPIGFTFIGVEPRWASRRTWAMCPIRSRCIWKTLTSCSSKAITTSTC